MKKLLAFFILYSCCAIEPPTTSTDPLAKKLKEFISDNKNVNKNLLFSLSDSTIHKIDAKYYGKIKINSGNKLKILGLVTYTGLLEDAVGASGEIIIYNDENEQLGKYEVGGKNDIPTGVNLDRYLIFKPALPCNLETRIDFIEGPPNELFINCTDSGGDLYSYSPS